MKTTLLGVLTIIGAVASAGIALLKHQPPDMVAMCTAVSAGFGLIHARDQH